MFFQYKYRLTWLLILSAVLLLVAGCSASGSQDSAAEATQSDDSHDDSDHSHDASDHSHDEEAHDDSEPHARIPNENGAAIRIVSPADGDTFHHGDQIVVEVQTENFDLTQEGYHWHVYVDGSSWGMIMGGSASHVLSGVEPGEHEISAYLSIPTHEEYEDGDAVTITVEE
ncbi:MAG: hypothetical protein BroJett015_08250 [Chloroflexota bacterium]|nr:hypothetical protein [Ardenticatenaceae bacterium]GIK55162.1 MAG: hypothetical protein BroJett015_08250 [Chloroflexota bacterium]